MANRIARIATLLLCGITSGITIGGALFSTLPWYIAVSTVVAVAVVTICSFASEA